MSDNTQVNAEETQKQAALFQALMKMRQEAQTIMQKGAELDQQHTDHTLLIETMEPMDADRKAWRMVGGVLMEGTCGEILPIIKTQKEKLFEYIKQLEEEYKKKNQAIREFEMENRADLMKFQKTHSEMQEKMKQLEKQEAAMSTGGAKGVLA
eukprot:TRINITY_DN1796_c0_g1_i1.p1 TRINITY_DN1796_c0_g1~~TRINITY_DN1796_c0_g1_i1.p1  ORF type:complete len:153 (-),score=49.12 TRINITY_DN1796_c0_g1_i1:23-481(-)